MRVIVGAVLRVMTGAVICGFVGAGISAVNSALGSPVPHDVIPLIAMVAGMGTMFLILNH